MVALNERKAQNNESASGQNYFMRRNHHDPPQILHGFSYIIQISCILTYIYSNIALDLCWEITWNVSLFSSVFAPKNYKTLQRTVKLIIKADFQQENRLKNIKNLLSVGRKGTCFIDLSIVCNLFLMREDGTTNLRHKQMQSKIWNNYFV